jgi:hypothetical protein
MVDQTKKVKAMEHKLEVPLRWPEGWGRTLIDQRKRQASWKRPLEFYREAVLKELSRIGVSAATISYNERHKERIDPGVAVWFSLKPAEDFGWQSGLGLDNPAPTVEEIDTAYRARIGKHHPDRIAQGSGGDVAMFHRLSEWRKQARAWVLGTNAPALDNCIPCDRFVEIRQNLAAIRMALGAFRQLERVGIPAILERVMDRAFKAALPAGQEATSGK